jgi:hypothetical protein
LQSAYGQESLLRTRYLLFLAGWKIIRGPSITTWLDRARGIQKIQEIAKVNTRKGQGFDAA